MNKAFPKSTCTSLKKLSPENKNMILGSWIPSTYTQIENAIRSKFLF